MPYFTILAFFTLKSDLKYFLHLEKIIQMPLNWANCNQSKIWFCQMNIQEICHPTYFYQFFMSGWLPAIKWHWKKVAWSKLDQVSKNMAIIYSKWKLFCQKGIKLTPFWALFMCMCYIFEILMLCRFDFKNLKMVPFDRKIE